ncbi:hypothetical protein CYMTET_18979 [Cymbomonas tetramitiformis]|uniref:Uncharacterized protein n=1 Tax=Cymbomonas tetramitiformis TaxID=36881 RepID=A0AAE0G7D5_9CHLO|nr:hypothetical protein CYMTET_18979 [Cymbomonas tetramitiformis]
MGEVKLCTWRLDAKDYVEAKFSPCNTLVAVRTKRGTLQVLRISSTDALGNAEVCTLAGFEPNLSSNGHFEWANQGDNASVYMGAQVRRAKGPFAAVIIVSGAEGVFIHGILHERFKLPSCFGIDPSTQTSKAGSVKGLDNPASEAVTVQTAVTPNTHTFQGALTDLSEANSVLADICLKFEVPSGGNSTDVVSYEVPLDPSTAVASPNDARTQSPASMQPSGGCDKMNEDVAREKASPAMHKRVVHALAADPTRGQFLLAVKEEAEFQHGDGGLSDLAEEASHSEAESEHSAPEQMSVVLFKLQDWGVQRVREIPLTVDESSKRGGANVTLSWTSFLLAESRVYALRNDGCVGIWAATSGSLINWVDARAHCGLSTVPPVFTPAGSRAESADDAFPETRAPEAPSLDPKMRFTSLSVSPDCGSIGLVSQQGVVCVVDLHRYAQWSEVQQLRKRHHGGKLSDTFGRWRPGGRTWRGGTPEAGAGFAGSVLLRHTETSKLEDTFWKMDRGRSDDATRADTQHAEETFGYSSADLKHCVMPSGLHIDMPAAGVHAGAVASAQGLHQTEVKPAHPVRRSGSSRDDDRREHQVLLQPGHQDGSMSEGRRHAARKSASLREPPIPADAVADASSAGYEMLNFQRLVQATDPELRCVLLPGVPVTAPPQAFSLGSDNIILITQSTRSWIVTWQSLSMGAPGASKNSAEELSQQPISFKVDAAEGLPVVTNRRVYVLGPSGLVLLCSPGALAKAGAALAQSDSDPSQPRQTSKPLISWETTLLEHTLGFQGMPAARRLHALNGWVDERSLQLQALALALRHRLSRQVEDALQPLVHPPSAALAALRFLLLPAAHSLHSGHELNTTSLENLLLVRGV